MNKILGFLFVFAAISMGTCLAQSGQFRGPARDGHFPDKNLLDVWPENGPEITLEIEGIGNGYGSCAINSDAIFVAGEKDSLGTVYAYDHSGVQIWKYEYGIEFMYKYFGSRSTPTLDENCVYYFGGMGDAFCLNMQTGKPVWHINLVNDYGCELLRWGNSESPLVVDDKIIFTPGGTKHNMIALNKKTGELIWTTLAKGDKSSYCSPVLIQQNNKQVIVTQTEAYIIGVDATNGKLLWAVENNSTRGTNPNTPLIYDGMLFNSVGYGYGSDMFRLKDDFSTPDTIWTTKEMDSKMEGPLLIDGYIYGCGDRNKKWFCYNWQTGKKMWESKDFKISSMIYADGKIFAHAYEGGLALIKPNPEKFELISTVPTLEGDKLLFAHPILFQGKLYIRENGKVTVYNVSKK